MSVIKFENLIAGQWVGAQSGEWFDRTNPADTSETIGSFPAMSREDGRFAIEAAAAAATEWREVGIMARAQILLDAAVRIRARDEEIALDITRENGKTLTEARGEVRTAAAFLEYFGGLGRAPVGSLLPDARPGVRGWAAPEPLGVVALITPWNDPLVTPARKMAPALLAGNTVVIKPASHTPLGTLHLVRALAECGLPPGVVNVLTGSASELGPVLMDSTEISAVSFTGSTEVGRSIETKLAGSGTRVQAEMGGKNAAVVMPDADLDVAVAGIIGGAFGQTGQRCTATSRLIAHEAIATELAERLVAAIEGLHVGAGTEDGVQVGPLVTDLHRASVIGALERAHTEGATRLAGGSIPGSSKHSRGHFLLPALLSGVGTSSQTWQAEIFGPVLAMATTRSLDEGIEMVNDTRYGLSSSLYSQSLADAYRFSEGVATGQVTVNLPTTGWDVHVPFGGFGDSGSAFKEHGLDALRFYSRVKSVMMRVE